MEGAEEKDIRCCGCRPARKRIGDVAGMNVLAAKSCGNGRAVGCPENESACGESVQHAVVRLSVNDPSKK